MFTGLNQSKCSLKISASSCLFFKPQGPATTEESNQPTSALLFCNGLNCGHGKHLMLIYGRQHVSRLLKVFRLDRYQQLHTCTWPRRVHELPRTSLHSSNLKALRLKLTKWLKLSHWAYGHACRIKNNLIRLIEIARPPCWVSLFPGLRLWTI